MAPARSAPASGGAIQSTVSIKTSSTGSCACIGVRSLSRLAKNRPMRKPAPIRTGEGRRRSGTRALSQTRERQASCRFESSHKLGNAIGRGAVGSHGGRLPRGAHRAPPPRRRLAKAACRVRAAAGVRALLRCSREERQVQGGEEGPLPERARGGGGRRQGRLAGERR